jgi:hypothetical protein
MQFVRLPIFSTAMIFTLGLVAGLSITGLGNAMQQHVKVAELYKADLVTSEGKSEHVPC